MEDNAFGYYKGTTLIIPYSVMIIGSYAFKGCTSEIIWEANSSLTILRDYAFSYYKGTTLIIPNSVTSIGNYAFSDCSSLTSVTIGDSVKSIGEYAFYNCTGLTSITIPDSVRSIGKRAFSLCSSLQEVTIPFVGASANVTSSNQYPFGYIFDTSSYKGGTATEQRYILSSGSIKNYTYYIPTSLRKVTITGGDIVYGAFSSCKGLTSITIGDSVTSIVRYAFSGCVGLTSVTIGNSVTRIGNLAFNGCSSLTSITFKNTNDWIVSKKSDMSNPSSLPSSSLENTSTASDYLRSKYIDYYWKRR